MEKPRDLDLKQADEILHEYTQPGSMIDNGNLFFAAHEYKAAYDELVRALEICRDVLLLGLGPYSDHKAGVLADETLKRLASASKGEAKR